MSTELTSGSMDGLQNYSFIALKRYLDQHGVSRSSIRYRATASLAHPAGEVTGVTYDRETSIVTVDVSFMGLYGTLSPMPVYYTEQVLDEVNQGREVEGGHLKPFFDLFNHQAVSLFYDAWCKYKLPYHSSFGDYYSPSPHCSIEPKSIASLSATHNGAGGVGNEFCNVLLALWGIDQRCLTNFKQLTFSHLLSLAGLLSLRVPSAERLSQALNLLFHSVQIELSDLDNRRFAIPADQLSRLGTRNAELGETAMLGEQISDCSGVKVNVTLNDASDLSSWLPNGHCNEAARELIKLMLGSSVEYEITLSIDESGIEPSVLGGEQVQLGLNGCLASNEELLTQSGVKAKVAV